MTYGFLYFQVVKFVLEAVGVLCQADIDWLTDNVADILGIAKTFLHFGLEGWQHRIPTKLFPLPGAMTDPPKAPNIKVRIIIFTANWCIKLDVLHKLRDFLISYKKWKLKDISMVDRFYSEQNFYIVY
jgi:hypothetical protein